MIVAFPSGIRFCFLPFTGEVFMSKRRHMSRRASKHVFRKGASRVHKKNLRSPMRGGFRI